MFKLCCMVAVACVTLSGTAVADIINVPGDYPTIQAGIDAAMDGDEVVVADGVYTGPGNKNLDFGGKLITVRSASGDPSLCIIDCEGSGQGFSFHSGETSDAVVEGFTITNGSVFDAPGGGGIICSGSSPTVSKCAFSDNWAAGFGGGGVLCINSSPTLIDCTFTSNSVSVSDGANGGGMCNVLGSAPIVVGCNFASNSAFDFEDFGSPRGGAIYNSESSPILIGCTFTQNQVNGDQSFGEGGAIYNGSSSNPMLIGCTFADNYAGGDGADAGAMYNRGSDPLLINTLFTNNSSCEGAGAVTNNDSSPMVINSTFSHNGSFRGALLNLVGSNPTVIGCILWHNGATQISGPATVTYSCVQGGWSGTGNIDADPLFVDPDGLDDDIYTWQDNDYRLSPGSPCIDAADNTAVPKGIDTDLDGSPRFVDDLGTPDTGNADCVNPIVDMGAYEFLPSPSPPGDLNGDGVVGIIDLLMLLASWGDCPALPEQCSADLNYDCVVGITDLLTLLANWG